MDTDISVSKCAWTLDNTIRCFFMVAVFFAIFSPTSVYIGAFAAVLTVFSKTIRIHFAQLFRLLPVRLGSLYLALVLVGIFYTPATTADIFKEVQIVVFFAALLPLLIPAFADKRWQHRLLLALLGSVLLLALRMIADHYHIIPRSWQQFFLFHVHYIQQGATLVALGIYIALHLALCAKSKFSRAVFIVLAIFLILVCLAFQRERVGMVLSFVSLLIFFLQHLRALRWLALMLVGYALLLGASYMLSASTHSRIQATIHSTHLLIKGTRIEQTEQSTGEPAKASEPIQAAWKTSVGGRWYVNKYGIKASMLRPLWGFGTGTFSKSHQSNPPELTQHKNLLMYLEKATPEVGSIFVVLRHGWVGAIVFAAFMFAWWWATRPLGFKRSTLVFAVLCILMLADCSYPAFYHSRAWVWLFAVLVAAMGERFAISGMTERRASK